jgi:ABC-type lipoprotein export system ATPase subunit
MVAIMGPSGSGKTSLLNVLSQRHHLSSGSHVTGNILLNGALMTTRKQFSAVGSFV